MRLIIAGHSVVDHVYRNGKELILPGGIYYSALGFLSIKGDGDNLALLTTTAECDYDIFKGLFEEFDASCVNKLEGLPHITFYEDGKVKRREDYSKYVPGLDYSGVTDWNNYDGLYINMITGYDLKIDDFPKIREKYNGKIYLDIHTLARELTEKNHRYFRKIKEYRQIMPSVNYVQVNEDELLTITPYDELEKILETIFKLGVEILILTQGKNGVKVFTQDGKTYDLEAVKVNSVNRLGCGDVFGSFFFYLLSSGKDIAEAAEKANFAAALITTYGKTKDFMRLRNDFFERYT